MVKLVVDTALVGGKKLAQPWLGFSAQPVTAEIATTLGLDRPTGLIVKDVSPGSPAAQAGLKTGDVVTKIDDFEVNDPQGLRFRAATKGIGNTVNVAYLRDGAKNTAALRLVRAPENPPRSITEIDGDNPLSGVTVANLSPAYAEELQIEITSGVIITEMGRRSIAARLGFRPGDIVKTVNGRKIATVQALQDALRGTPDKWELSVERDGEILNLSVRA
jgi:S1-C subfamily serine protease